MKNQLELYKAHVLESFNALSHIKSYFEHDADETTKEEDKAHVLDLIDKFIIKINETELVHEKELVPFYKQPQYDGAMSETYKDSEDVNMKITYLDCEKQYKERGFDESVTWSLDYSISKWLIPRLELYLEIASDIIVAPELMEDVKYIIKGLKVHKAGWDGVGMPTEEENAIVQKALGLLAKNYEALWH